MPRILLCFPHEHEGWDKADWIRDSEWDHQEGYGLVASATINGQAEFLRCAVCRWESGAKVEKVLGSVGNPSISTKPHPNAMPWKHGTVIGPVGTGKPEKVKKEKNVAKTETPKKRDRRRGTVLTRKFSESVTATLSVSGGLTDYLILGEEDQADLYALVEKMGTPKGA